MSKENNKLGESQNNFKSSSFDYAGFLAVKDQLTTNLAEIIKRQLEKMGSDIKGISWFSSEAESYVGSQNG